MKNNIRIYEIKSEYIKYLSNYQEHIFDQADGKGNRKYIGIVLELKGVKYFAPLSSYKDKHKKMKEGVDFIKIKDYAVINLNNMIPVPDNQIINIDINKEKNPNYKYLLQAESREVNRQKNRIRKNAEIVYSHKKHNGKKTALAKRTNDFEKLEKLCKEYCENGTDLKIIQEIMGHSDITTTMNIYNEATKERKQESFARLEGKIKIC